MSFVDTTLIECNRMNSVEKDTINSNNSIFTNRIGNPIRLEPGDTISVDSAFINQKGCANLSAIEFKGEKIGNGLFTETKGIEYKKLNNYDMDNIAFYFKTNKEEEKELYDNKCIIPVNYYKTSNGEGYTFLPRKYYGRKYENNTTTHPNYHTPEQEWTEPISKRDITNLDGNGDVFNKGYNSGVCFYLPTQSEWKYYNSNDYHKVWEDPVGDTQKNYIWVKPKNDNSKFTMFRKDCFFKNFDTTDYVVNDAGDEYNAEEWYKKTGDMNEFVEIYKYSPYRYDKDVALNSYSMYQELLELDIDKGFQSPGQIQLQLTQQLQEEVNNSPNTFTTKLPGDTDFSIEMTNAIETKLYKTFSCASTHNYSVENYDFFKSNANAERNSQTALDYTNAYNTIYVKRPDLFVAGRKVNNWAGNVSWYNTNGVLEDPFNFSGQLNGFGRSNHNRNLITRNTTTGGNYETKVITSWFYNKDNLNKLRDLFKIQGRYPELFSNSNLEPDDNAIFNHDDDNGDPLPTATINNSRFLHMDIRNTRSVLGSDGYEKNNSFNLSERSIPFFFKYDPSLEDTYINDPDTTRLCYGFATKEYDNDDHGVSRPYICLHPELVNGLDEILFAHRGGVNTPGNITAYSTRLGWDYHFNSWGNVVMLNWSGITTQNYDGTAEVGSAGYYGDIIYPLGSIFNSTYSGANNSAVVYDPGSEKFSFEYLHIPENIGNPYNAGETKLVGGVKEDIPAIEDANDECYKINKRLTPFTYCPDCIPYDPDVEGQINAVYDRVEKTSLSLLNKNIQPWTIFDAHMGVYLNLGDSIRLPERSKHLEEVVFKKSFLYKLGFTYDQLNPQVINQLNNYQARVKYDNIYNLKYITTNSQVISTDTKEMVVNHYGNPMFTTQLSMPFRFPHFLKGSTAQDPDDDTKLGYYPAISINTGNTSINVSGLELPKIVSIPYLTIRSDIISESKYLGGKDSGLILPIVCVVNKINADKDYIQVEGSSMVFTCKQSTIISSITTAITNTQGELATTDEDNSVIYKIQKNNNITRYNIMDQILKKK
jgi:hypothetical protein